MYNLFVKNIDHTTIKYWTVNIIQLSADHSLLARCFCLEAVTWSEMCGTGAGVSKCAFIENQP